MKFVFICQAVDQNDPILATTIQWLETFAKYPQVEEITVLALRVGEYALPDNITVFPIQRKNRLTTLVRFYKAILTAIIHNKADFFFIYQGGSYPLLLLPFKLLMGKPIYQWKANTYISPQMRFYAKYCNTKIFTSTSNAFPLALPEKIKIVGQGIDTKKFSILPHQRKIKDIVTIGRIIPVKQLGMMLRVLDACVRYYGKAYRLDIYGPDSAEHPAYKEQLYRLIEELNLSSQVSFKGAVSHDDLPGILNEYRILMNFCQGALDRAIVEAMACGLPVISTNACFAEILSQKFRDVLLVPDDNLEHQAKVLHRLLSQDDAYLAEMGYELREIAVHNHNIEQLSDRILSDIANSK